MKAVTIRQPWAWAIARGHKPIENRHGATSHRGLLAIHAAREWDTLGDAATREVVRLARAQGSTLPARLSDDLPYSGVGLVIATVDLVDVCTASRRTPTVVCDCGPWAQAFSTHWRFADAQVLAEPVPARGWLPVWDWTPPTPDVLGGEDRG